MCIRGKTCLLSSLIQSGIVLAVLSSGAAWAAFDEHQIKTAFLYRLPSFITGRDWGGQDSFNLCAVSPNSYMSTYSNLDGRSIRELKIRFIRKTRNQSFSECNLLFVGAQAEKGNGEFLQRLPGKNVLVVGETSRFVRDGGGAIALVRKGDKVSIEINLEALLHAGFTADSDLLELATIVEPSF